MGIQQVSRYCYRCKKRTLHQKQTMNAFAGCLLTVMSLGLFLPLWMLGNIMAPKTCQQCGRKRY